MTLRQSLIQHLKTNVPLVKGEVYQPHMAGPGRKLPYLVLKMAGDADDTSHRNAYVKVIEVWPYCNPDNYVEVDAITTQVINALRQDINAPAGVVQLYYRGTGSDYYDPDLKQITNGPISFDLAYIKEEA